MGTDGPASKEDEHTDAKHDIDVRGLVDFRLMTSGLELNFQSSPTGRKPSFGIPCQRWEGPRRAWPLDRGSEARTRLAFTPGLNLSRGL